MIEDIWTKKPESINYSEVCSEVDWYNADEIDAYLEKVKDHSDYYENLAAEFAELYADAQEKADAMLRFRKAAEDLGEYAADLDDKLDVIKNIVAKYDKYDYAGEMEIIKRVLEGNK